MTRLLDLAGQVDGYWPRHEFSHLYRDLRAHLSAAEQDALLLIEKALFRLFPFEPEYDLPENMPPQHAV